MPRPSAERAPLLVAICVAAGMVWLARGPFDAPPAQGGVVSLFPLELRAPQGTLAAFPRSFSWSESPGTDAYEVAVVSEKDRRTLFRQRGDVPGLELTFDPGTEPPPGAYVWEVTAYRRGAPFARGVGRFVVRPEVALPDPTKPTGP